MHSSSGLTRQRPLDGGAHAGGHRAEVQEGPARGRHPAGVQEQPDEGCHQGDARLGEPGGEGLHGANVIGERCRPPAARQGDILAADTPCVHTCLQGENAWVFVKEDCIADTVKFYFKFEEDLFTEAKKVAAKNQEVKKPTEVSVAAMGTSYLSPAEVRWVSWMQGQRGRPWRVRAGANSTARCHSALLGLMALLLRILVHAVEEVRVSANKEAAVRHHRWPCQAASNQDCHRHQDGAHQAGHCATEGVRAGRGQVQDRWLARQGVSTKQRSVNMAWYFCTLRSLACWLHMHPGQDFAALLSLQALMLDCCPRTSPCNAGHGKPRRSDGGDAKRVTQGAW